MATEVYIPKMSDHMETGEFITWLVQEGDTVSEGAPIAEINTDKTVAEIEAPATGVVKGIRKGLTEGSVVAVGETICFIAKADEKIPELPAIGDIARSSGAPPRASRESTAGIAAGDQFHGSRAGGAIRATPSARRLAKELGVDINGVTGSGPAGRIHDEDVRAVAAGPTNGGSDGVSGGEWIGLTSIERSMGSRMLESAREIPQFSIECSMDMTHAIERAREEGSGITALLISMVAKALRRFPRLNGTFEQQRIRLNRDVNIGVAVASDRGLQVPVIKQADTKDLPQISEEIAALRKRCDDGTLRGEDIAEGTFTISNLGPLHVDRFVAMVNPPQAAILAVGEIANRPVALDGTTLGVRPLMSATLTADHRVVDGATASRFLNTVRDLLDARS